MLAQCVIKISGSDMPRTMYEKLDSVEVDDGLYIPSMCTLTFDNPSHETIDLPNLDIGKELVVSMAPESHDGQPSLKKIFEGEIVAIEPTWDFTMNEQFSRVTVRAYSRAHRLMGTRRTKAFEHQKDSDIASVVAGTGGLSAQVDDSGVQHDYVLQDNQTDFEFLQSRARRIGYVVRVEGKNLLFKKPDQLATGPVTVTLGEQILSFRPRMAATAQFGEVKVTDWDRKEKQAIVGQSTSPSAVGSFGANGHSTRTRAFSQDKWLLVGTGAATQSEAEKVAQALHALTANGFVTAEGELFGDPNVLPGTKLDVKKAGTRFSGTYFVTRVLHRLDPVNGYVTWFEADNGNGETTGQLLAAGADAPAPRPTAAPGAMKVAGVVTGIVTNNKDPDGWSRVKVKFPWLSDTTESTWAPLASPMAGSGRGLQLIPEVNDEVLVAFEHGNPARPYVLGALWNGMDHPPLSKDAAVGSDGKVVQRVLKTTGAFELMFDETPDGAKIELKTKEGHRLTLDEKNQKVELVEKGGHKIVLDGQAKKVTISSTSDMSVEATKINVSATNITVEAKASLELKANGSLKISAPTVDVEGNTALTLKGGIVQINSGGRGDARRTGRLPSRLHRSRRDHRPRLDFSGWARRLGQPFALGGHLRHRRGDLADPRHEPGRARHAPGLRLPDP